MNQVYIKHCDTLGNWVMFANTLWSSLDDFIDEIESDMVEVEDEDDDIYEIPRVLSHLGIRRFTFRMSNVDEIGVTY